MLFQCQFDIRVVFIICFPFQRDKLNDIVTEMENIRYPESDAEAIDAALAEHEDRKAALQIQRDILNQSKAGIFDETEKAAKLKQNGKAANSSSSSDSSSDDDEDKTIQVSRKPD